MENTLFLQPAVADPYRLYDHMLAHHPVYWDERNRHWAVYSHHACKAILDSNALIPPLQEGGSNTAVLIKAHLARLCNPPEHTAAKAVAVRLYNRLMPVSIPDIMRTLLEDRTTIEWVSDVCLRLPLLYLLKGFGFSGADEAVILQHTASLAKTLSSPNIHELYAITERHLINTDHLYDVPPAQYPLYVSNMMGLFIQAYDAGRGILSNALLQLLRLGITDVTPAAVREALRIDPPVHNTRRVLQDDITLEGHALQRGTPVLVVLAAANRDPAVFRQPDVYDSSRTDYAGSLTFGSGIHRCLADHAMVHITTSAIRYLFSAYKTRLVEEEIIYEPLVNLRLPKAIHLSLTKY